MPKVIRYDGKKYRAVIECDGVPYPAKLDDCGFPIYDIPNDRAVARLVTTDSSKYRLFESAPLHIKKFSATGASEWVTERSWKYERQVVQTGVDPDNGEVIFENRFVWSEDFRDFTVPYPEKVAKVPNGANEELATKTALLVKAVKTIDSLQASNVELQATVSGLQAKVAELEAVKTADAIDPNTDFIGIDGDPTGAPEAPVGKPETKTVKKGSK